MASQKTAVAITPSKHASHAKRGMRRSKHIVQFYENDSALVETVVSFLADGLRRKEACVIIATPKHLEQVAKLLKERAVDSAVLRDQDQYVALDAQEMLSKIMVDGLPDAKLFGSVVGSLIARLAKNGRRVRAFGEMVALLWAQRNNEGALQLEQLWNALGKKHSFALLCGYPMKGFNGVTNIEPFSHICDEHTEIVSAGAKLGSRSKDRHRRSAAILQQKANSLKDEVALRERIEKELLRRDKELTAFLQTSSIGLHWVGPDGIIQWANPADWQLLGYTRKEYIGHLIAEFHADKKVVNEMLERLSKDEKLRDFPARLKCKDGSIKSVLIDSSVLWEDGRFLHTQTFTRDVTEIEQARRAESRLAAIVESSDDAIISKDLNGIITTWNLGATRIFGYTAEEAIGKPVLMLIPPDHVDEEPFILSRIRRGERIDHYETVRQHKDGHLIHISLTVSPIKDAAGRIVGASKIVRDISTRISNERALREARENLIKANEDLESRVQERTASLKNALAQMEEFSYTVSHDLRAPLRAMQAYSEVIAEDFGHLLASAPEAMQFLKRISDNAKRLDGMILDVLTLSRISRADLQMSAVNLDKLVREILPQYLGFQGANIDIRVEPLIDVIGHEPSLMQAVSNLLTNAVKFVAPGVIPKIKIWTERVGPDVRLWVEDNGIGVDPKYHHRLFKIFERINPQSQYEGNGVGLAIVQKAVQRMNGTCGLESSGENGSRFWIQLPAAREPLS